MEAVIYSGTTEIQLLDSLATFSVPLGRSDWILSPPVSVIFQGATNEIWPSGTVRGYATIGLVNSNSISVTPVDYPASSDVVWIGVVAGLVAWMTAALILRGLKGAATQTVPDL